jgi:hypothetical protein
VATPTYVRGAGGPSAATDGAHTFASYTCALADPTISGNKLIVVGQYAVNAGITSITIKTDQNDTFSIDHTGVTGDGNQTVIIASVTPTVGSKNFTVTFNGTADATFTQWAYAEVNNLGALDVTGENTATNASMLGGSATPTVAGDYLQAIFEPETGVGGTSWAVGTNSNITWNLGQSDIGYGSGQTCSQMFQYGVQSVAAAINPAATQNPSTTYGAVWAAYKAATAGGTPSGMYIATVQHYNLKTTGTSFTIPAPIPASCNLGVLHVITAPSTGPITAVVGSVSGTWTHIGDQANHNGSGILMDWYKPNGTFSTADVLTITATVGLSVADCNLYGIVGAATAPLDTAATATTGSFTSGFGTNTGDQGTAGTSLTPMVATPSTSNGIFINHTGVNSQGITGTSGTCFSDIAWSPQEAGENDLDENNGKCHANYSSTAAITVTYTSAAPGGGSVALNGWATAGEFFMAPASGGTVNAPSFIGYGLGY